MGVPLNHPSIDGIFHEINHPSSYGETPIYGNLHVEPVDVGIPYRFMLKLIHITHYI